MTTTTDVASPVITETEPIPPGSSRDKPPDSPQDAAQPTMSTVVKSPSRRRAPQPNQRKSEPAAFLPTSGEDLLARTGTVCDVSRSNGESHSILASRWDLVDTWARLTVALAAALSALSLFQNNTEITTVFAVVTAIGSALTAALDPARRSAQHRAAQRAFRKTERASERLYDSAYAQYFPYVAEPGVAVDGRPYDTDHLARAVVSETQLEELGERLVKVETEFEMAEDNAPALNRFFGRNPDGTPRTRLGLWQLKNQLALQRRVRDAYEEDRTETSRHSREQAVIVRTDR